MSVQISKARLIFKVLVVGRDLALQTGFLTQVSGRNVSTQLFNTLGMSLGIARYNHDPKFDVVLQLWSIPQNERLSGLSKKFAKGHRAVIAVMKPKELYNLQEFLNAYSIELDSNIVFVAIGSVNEASHAYREFYSHYYKEVEPIIANSATDVIDILSRNLVRGISPEPQRPTFVVLDDVCCPTYEPPRQTNTATECGDEEIVGIQMVLMNQGLRISGETCIVKIREGDVIISLRNGSVNFEPAICKFCIQRCKRQSNVCIIAIDSGWSSQGLSQKALLIAAKAIALADRNLPDHIENQIRRASRCNNFELNLELPADEIPAGILAPYPKDCRFEKSLLGAAEDRVRDGKLPKSAYNILKSKLLSVEGLKNKE